MVIPFGIASVGPGLIFQDDYARFERGMMTKHTWSDWPIVITWIHLKMPGTCKEALLRKWSHNQQKEKNCLQKLIQWAQISHQAIPKLYRSIRRRLRECTIKRICHSHCWFHFCHFSAHPNLFKWSVDLIRTWFLIIFASFCNPILQTWIGISF